MNNILLIVQINIKLFIILLLAKKIKIKLLIINNL